MTDFSERNLIIGMIVSTEFLKQIENSYNLSFIQSQTAKRIAIWCMDYYKKYNRAPQKDIETIFFNKAKNLQKEIAEEIELDILPNLSDEFERNSFNLDFMVDETRKYFNEQRLSKLTNDILSLLEVGKFSEAENILLKYKPAVNESLEYINFGDPTILSDIDRAFDKINEILVNFPGALGEFWNDQFVRDSFIAIMGSEKRGKTWILLLIAVLAAKQGRNVAFFEAGDMSKDQIIMRTCINLAGKSNKKRYCGTQYEPVKDCIFNQLDICTKKQRSSKFGVFYGKTEKWLRTEINLEELKLAYEDNPDYNPCTNCDEFETNKWGTPWYSEVDVGEPLTKEESQKLFEKFFIKRNRRFYLSVHPSGTLTIKKARAILENWENAYGFIPDIILFDYPDIMDDDEIKEFRHKQNAIWMKGRGLATEKHCCLVWVTQADAESYVRDLLTTKNFSEDKRKFAHPTAFYGLNQDHKGREKELGIMRINEIVIREGDFSVTNQVHILQNLRRGRPLITSYW